MQRMDKVQNKLVFETVLYPVFMTSVMEKMKSGVEMITFAFQTDSKVELSWNRKDI
jgi:hypothetical protein